MKGVSLIAPRILRTAVSLSAAAVLLAGLIGGAAVLIGTVVFGERLAASPAGLALQLAGAAATVTGIILLGRSPLTARAYSPAAGEHGLSAGPGSRPRHDRPLSQPPAVTPEHSGREGIKRH
ncbi:MAG TPA: hypothetical protein VE733_12255 [Streptosporangiaceae bacterium]|jgi:hypothetical protein|nr:hypothetical protein [Streptosporangiaceae bacterium]